MELYGKLVKRGKTFFVMCKFSSEMIFAEGLKEGEILRFSVSRPGDIQSGGGVVVNNKSPQKSEEKKLPEKPKFDVKFVYEFFGLVMEFYDKYKKHIDVEGEEFFPAMVLKKFGLPLNDVSKAHKDSPEVTEDGGYQTCIFFFAERLFRKKDGTELGQYNTMEYIFKELRKLEKLGFDENNIADIRVKKIVERVITFFEGRTIIMPYKCKKCKSVFDFKVDMAYCCNDDYVPDEDCVEDEGEDKD